MASSMACLVVAPLLETVTVFASTFASTAETPAGPGGGVAGTTAAKSMTTTSGGGDEEEGVGFLRR